MRLHLQESFDLSNSKVLAIPKGDKLVEGAQQFVGIAQDFPLVQAPACAGNNLSKQMKRINVLKNIRLTVGDQDHVELIQRLIYESNVILLDGSVLGSCISQLGERGQQSFDS